ncbi:MAG: CoA-binding protein [Pseudomonadota bacterium]|nr:MAG: CoA-binding protein [Pseudomonadota bacterium]
MCAEFVNPGLDEIKALLERSATIAVVGLSPKPARPSHHVAEEMQNFGYRIIPVRPAVNEVLGEKAYADLRAVPQRFDIVDVFRAPQYVDPIVDACIELQVPALWLQDGVVNEAAALRAQQAGIFVVMDRCIYRDYRDLIDQGKG